MKIELRYDPVGPETMVRINDQAVSAGDIYGFLYPVRECLLQTWLEPTGSWPGLLHNVRELVRGEEAEILFCGREADYRDVARALEGAGEISLGFQPWDAMAHQEERFQKMDSLLDHLLLDCGSDGCSMKDFFPESLETIQALREGEAGNWVAEIRTEADLERADQTALQCCVVADSYLDSYEKLENLRSLTRSMRRSPDMICCQIADRQKREEYQAFAAQYRYGGMRFAGGEEGRQEMEEKYGIPYRLRAAVQGYGKIRQHLENCFAQEAAIGAKKKALDYENKKTPKLETAREAEQLRQMLNWLQKNRIGYFTPFLELLRQAEGFAEKENRDYD